MASGFFGLNGPVGTTTGGGFNVNAPATSTPTTSVPSITPTSFGQNLNVSTGVGNGGFGLGGITSTPSSGSVISSGDAAQSSAGSGSGFSLPFGGGGTGSFDLGGLSSLFGGGGGGGGGDGPGGFLDNPLNGYHQVAYHWRFYTTGDTDNGKEIVIAESGATGFNIKDVHLRSFVGPTSQTHNTQMTEYTMTILEPMGIAFLDALYVAVVANNVKNVNKAFYWLELSFKGYKETGEIVPKITDGLANGGTWKFKIVINKLDTEMLPQGATYTLNGKIIHDVALEPEWQGVQSNIMVQAKTVEEFFNSLAEQMNKDVVRNNNFQLIKYAFKFHGNGDTPSAGSFKIKGGDVSKIDTYRQLSMVENDRNVWSANIQRGTMINRLVEDIIGVTAEGQSLALYGKVGGDLTKKPGGEFRDTVYYRVYPQVEYTGPGGPGDYNETFGQYYKTVTLHVKPYRSQATILDAQETKKDSSTSEAWNKVKGNCRKKYEYIYTGLNTEVIDCQLRFDLAWAAALPRFSGWEYTNDMIEHHAVFDQDGDKAFKAYKQASQRSQQGQGMINAGQQTQQNLLSQNPLQAIQAFGQTALGIGGSGLGMFGISPTGVNSSVGNQAPGGAGIGGGGSFLGTLNGAIGQIGQGQAMQGQAEIDMKNARAQLERQQSAASGNVGSGTYVEDMLNGQASAATFTQMSLTQQAESARRANGTGMQAQRGNIGRSIYGAMLDQLHDNRMFQNIEITVRGDPFWLGGNYETVFSDGQQDPNTTDYTKGDICLALCFNYPYGVHEETGQPNLRPQDAYNGAYRAAKITHDFQDGKFTQTIVAQRLAKIPAKVINEAVKAGAGGAGGAAGAGGSNVQAATSGLSSNTTATGTSGTGTGTGAPSPTPAATTPTLPSSTGGVPSFTTTPVIGGVPQVSVPGVAGLAPIGRGYSFTPQFTTQQAASVLTLR